MQTKKALENLVQIALQATIPQDFLVQQSLSRKVKYGRWMAGEMWLEVQ
jgi:hypothetical protein